LAATASFQQRYLQSVYEALAIISTRWGRQQQQQQQQPLLLPSGALLFLPPCRETNGSDLIANQTNKKYKLQNFQK